MFDLKIQNFRGFQNQEFKFSRINILIGENNGGKSSLLKLLLSLKQTLDSPLEVNLKLSGDYTDLGNFEEAIYYKKKGKKLLLKFSENNKYHDFFLGFITPYLEGLTKEEANIVKRHLSQYKVSDTSLSFQFSSKLNDHSTIKTIITNSKIGKIELLQLKGIEEANIRDRIVDIKYDIKNKTGILENCAAYKQGFFTIVIGTELEDICKKKFKNLHLDYFYSLAYLLVFQNYIQNHIDRIRFVNPIGATPKRFYFKEDRKASYKLIDIEKFVNTISDHNLPEKKQKERLDILNLIIKRFGIAEEIDIVRDKRLPVLALIVKTRDFWSNITDVGYGVSLQLPVLFQAILSEYYTKAGQTILIEQPEVHLHPTLQAKFIDTLLSIGPKNSYFIETHSEHIIRKLQVLVKEGTHNLKPEDITIHYFRREPLKFEVSKHQILPDGKLTPQFPSGFFDTSYSLVKQLL